MKLEELWKMLIPASTSTDSRQSLYGTLHYHLLKKKRPPGIHQRWVTMTTNYTSLTDDFVVCMKDAVSKYSQARQ